MNRILHTILLARDRTMAFTWRTAWRWSGILYEQAPAIAAMLILAVAYGVVND